MYAQVGKPKQSKSRAVANTVEKRGRTGQYHISFEDNRSGVKRINRLQLLMNPNHNSMGGYTQRSFQ
jgi:hypothetical protein